MKRWLQRIHILKRDNILFMTLNINTKMFSVKLIDSNAALIIILPPREEIRHSSIELPLQLDVLLLMDEYRHLQQQ